MTDHDRDADATIVGTLRKNAREELRVAVQTFKGHDLIALRVWADDGKGGAIPTKAGVNVRVAQLDAVLDLLRQARAVAVERGLLPEPGGA